MDHLRECMRRHTGTASRSHHVWRMCWWVY